MRRLAVIGALLVVAGPAPADVVSEKPDAVEVTIYRDHIGSTRDVADMDEEARGLGLISETRTFDVPAGESVIKFRGVAATIVPQSAKLESLPAEIVETNFDFQLLGPGELTANSLGQSVTLVRTDRASGRTTSQRGVLLSGPRGVVLNIDGKFEALGCSGAEEKLLFDQVPPTLADRPTLSAKIKSTRAGRFTVRLSYLATGFDWSADYVARIQPNGKKLDLAGWVTLANKQTTSFGNAPVQVVAGRLSIDAETVAQEVIPERQAPQCWPIGRFYSLRHEQMEFKRMAARANGFVTQDAPVSMDEIVVTGSYIVHQRELGDYKLYALPFPTDLNAMQVKQVRMLDQRNVPFERVYTIVVDEEMLDETEVPAVLRPFSLLRMMNRKEQGLGKPLPSGIVSVMETDSTRRDILAGEQQVQDVPVGLPIELEIGLAMDIDVAPRTVRRYDVERGDDEFERLDIEVSFVNRKSAAVVIEYYQHRNEDSEFQLIRASKQHALKHGMPLWKFKLRAGEAAKLRYTLESIEPY